MSTRAIASATGVSDQTVRADLSGQVRDFTQVTGTDGKQYTATQPTARPEDVVDAAGQEVWRTAVGRVEADAIMLVYFPA